MQTLSLVARAYVGAVFTVALLAVAPLPWVNGVDWSALGVLAALFVFFELVSAYRIGLVGVSAVFPISLAGMILLPPSGVALVALLGAVAYGDGSSSWIRRLFNAGQLAVSAFSGGLAYELLGGKHRLDVEIFPEVLVPVAAAAATYCVVNGSLLAGVLVLTQRVSFVEVWRNLVGSSLAPYLGYGAIGLMMAVLWQSRFGPFAAILVLLPLFVAKWAFAQYAEQQAAYEATIRSLVQAVETKDYYTRGHSERVARACEMIARELGMREARIRSLRYAGILHDVGKLGVPTRLLQKPDALTADEWAAFQLHPMRGVEMVREIDFLDEATAGILHHHERLDGKGYPMGLLGNAIPEFARVIAVADAFDSMTSTRSYRAARPVEEARAELRRCAGAQFDPRMVVALEHAIDKMGWQTAGPPTAPPTEGAEIAHYDHDDPMTALPVVPTEGK